MGTRAQPAPDLRPDPAELEARCAALELANQSLTRINEALMDRVERDMDMQGSSFSLFQAAIALEAKVKERTGALQDTLRTLEQTNNDLKASNDAAQAASRAKSAFLAAMSHELRTPMNGVVGMSELLMTTDLSRVQVKSVETIRRSALSLLTILNDILDFSKIEAGQMTLEATPFNLRKTADEVLALLRPQVEGKGLDLIMDWPNNLPSAVIGDPTRIAQIITNLVGNALKFTSSGYVRLRARLGKKHDNRQEYRFEIEDTGIGINEEAMGRLFTSFSQADSSTTRKFGGTGLGLAIVRRLSELMGGACGVTSEVGKGSCFWFSVSLEPNMNSEANLTTRSFARFRTPAALDGTSRKLRILLVEDNPINQEVASALLETLHCECTIADNGRLALAALAESGDFDLVLMDCQMPEMDGFEATKRIRADECESGGHIPIIALTANAMAGDRELCLAAGMDDFLSKPFQLHELSGMLGKWSPRADAAEAQNSKEMN
jgi:two-component system, sensor histidine kinase